VEGPCQFVNEFGGLSVERLRSYNHLMSQAALNLIEWRPTRRPAKSSYHRLASSDSGYLRAVRAAGQQTRRDRGILPNLSLFQMHSALAYYFQHRDEFLQEIREDEHFVTVIKRKLGPRPLAALKLTGLI
jgi:hypothetical protein